MNQNAPESRASEKQSARPRRLPIIVLAVMLVACGGIAYFTHQHLREAERNQEALLGDSVRAAAIEIGQYLESRQRKVKAFAIENRIALNAFAEDVGNDVLRRQIADRLRQAFPGYFTFTIADRDGTDLVDDLDGFVGRACQLSIQEYVEHLGDEPGGDTDYRAVIHPQANNYHFDVMAPWSDGIVLKGAFFVSFFPTHLRSALNAHEAPGHHLVLINSDRPYLIEVTSAGARDKISLRRDINLTDDEIARIKATQDIPGSHWRIVGYLDSDVMADTRTDAWFNAAMILALLVFAAAGILLVAPRTPRS